MAANSSFDIVSKFDQQELKNAVDQAERDIRTRYDLKDTKTEMVLTEKDITITTESEYSLMAVRDILESKLIGRKLSLKILDYQDEEEASGARVRQLVKLKDGIPDEIAKKITKSIRDEFKKVTPQIQGDTIRVQAKSRDDLQGVIALLNSADYPVALQFTNYR
jgi:cyclic-di-GMP-binding protein